MKKRKEKRAQLKRDMDHFTTVYWDKKARDEKTTKVKDQNYQHFWVNYNKKLVITIFNKNYFQRLNKRKTSTRNIDSVARICMSITRCKLDKNKPRSRRNCLKNSNKQG